MPFTFNELEIKGVYFIKPKMFNDSRGTFLEIYKDSDFIDIVQARFVQDNLSISKKGVIRGMHFQNAPMEQGKLVSVISGSIFDVMIDIRKGSKTFGKHIGIKISANERDMLWIPQGFAHGFQALEDNTVVTYKVTNEYSPTHEGGIIWNDSDLKIKWPIKDAIVSERDSEFPKFRNLK